jgi:GWxTD domain-containing protein
MDMKVTCPSPDDRRTLRNAGQYVFLPWLAATLLLLGTTSASAQETAMHQRQEGDIRVYVYIAGFKIPGDPTQTYVEIYYALDRGQMEFIELLPDSPGFFSSAWDIQTVIETEVGDQVTWSRWQRVSQDTNMVATRANQTAFDIYWPPPQLQPGVYRFITTVTDLNSRLTGETRIGIDERVVLIPDFSTSELTLSDIEFSVSLKRASAENRFVKNNLQVVPNPLRVYGVNLPILSFTNDLVALSDINAASLPRGSYRLIVEIVDDQTQERTVRTKDFQIISQVVATSPDELNTAPMTEENTRRFRDEIEYLATTEELGEYDALEPEAKRRLLVDFWKARDPNPATPENEFRVEWIERFDYANDNFTTPTQPEGWKSEQGRIFLVYGRPDETDPHPMDSAGGMPWVAWVYEQFEAVGRVVFVFVDNSGGFGSYRLVHSNVPGEMRNPNWWSEAGLGQAPPSIPPLN